MTALASWDLITRRTYANIAGVRLPTDPAFTKALLSSITTLIFGAALVVITLLVAGRPAPMPVFQYPKAATPAAAWSAPGCVNTTCDARIDK